MNQKIVVRIKMTTVIKAAAVGYLTVATMEALARLAHPYVHELNEKTQTKTKEWAESQEKP